MTADEAKRILFERHGEPWSVHDVALLIEELDRLQLLVDMYQDDARRMCSPPHYYSSGGTAALPIQTWATQPTRVGGLSAGQAWTSDDFDAPMELVDSEQVETWKSLEKTLDEGRAAKGERPLFFKD